MIFRCGYSSVRYSLISSLKLFILCLLKWIRSNSFSHQYIFCFYSNHTSNAVFFFPSVVLVFGSQHQNCRICSFVFFHFFSFRTQSTSFSHAFIPSFIHSLRPSFLPSFIPSVLPSFIQAFPPVSPTFRHSFPPSCSFIPSYIHVFPHYVIHSGHGWGMGYRPGIP